MVIFLSLMYSTFINHCYLILICIYYGNPWEFISLGIKQQRIRTSERSYFFWLIFVLFFSTYCQNQPYFLVSSNIYIAAECRGKAACIARLNDLQCITSKLPNATQDHPLLAIRIPTCSLWRLESFILWPEGSSKSSPLVPGRRYK